MKVDSRNIAAIIGTTAAFIILICLCYTVQKYKEIEKKWKEATENVKAYSSQYSSSKEENRVFKLTIDQLNYTNDSLFQEMNAIRKKLNIKDSKLNNVQYMASDFTKVDTLRLPGDTIFKDRKVNIDTLISDKWYSLRVETKYPSDIIIQPKFKSEKYIVVSVKRETVNPPKKFFLFRLFQKHHLVAMVDVVEKNPYVQNQTNRYVEIVK